MVITDLIVMQKDNTIKASGRIKHLTLLVSALILLLPMISHGFEFSGEKWKQKIRYYYMEGCPAYVLPRLMPHLKQYRLFHSKIQALGSLSALTTKLRSIAQIHPKMLCNTFRQI